MRRRASGALRPYVRDLLGSDSDLPAALTERRLPGLDVALVLNLGVPHRLFDAEGERVGVSAWVVGLQSGFRLAEAVGARVFMVVRLSPIGAHLILRQPMHLVADRIVELDDLDRRFARVLFGAASLARRWPERFTAVESVLAARLADAPAPELATRAMAALARGHRADGHGVGVAALAARLGCSHQQLIGELRQRVGLAPKRLARIARFNRALAAVHAEAGIERPAGQPHLDLRSGATPGPPRRRTDWADLAAAHGYYDQAHLIRDFRAFAGASPAAFLARLRAEAGQLAD